MLPLRVKVTVCQPIHQGRAEWRPFGVEDGKPGGIAVACLVHHGLAEDAFELKAQALGSRDGWRVQAVALPFKAAVAQGVKSVLHQQKLGLGGHGCALQQGRKGHKTHLNHAICRVHAHQRQRAHGAPGLQVNHCIVDKARGLRRLGGMRTVVGQRGEGAYGHIGPVAAIGGQAIGCKQCIGVACGIQWLQAAPPACQGAGCGQGAGDPLGQGIADRLVKGMGGGHGALAIERTLKLRHPWHVKSATNRYSHGAMMPAAHALFDTPLDKARSAEPLQRQLHQRLKQAILDQRLVPGSRLPASRSLAETLAVSRNTVTAAYAHLAAVGYVQQDRQGTRVAAVASASRVARSRLVPAQAPGAAPVIARRLAQICSTIPPADSGHALRPGIPALSHFPLAAWRRACDQAMRSTASRALGYGDPLGEPALRSAIAQHLAVARGVRCTPEQIVVTEGAQEALALCVRLLSNPGDTAWVEDPGYRGARVALQAGDLRVLPRRVDADGMVAAAADWASETPRLVYTTPSHQYPVGAVLTVARRLALIAQARAYGAWILEDDYDSEFRHAGEPIAAMQGLVAQAPVLYLGTFSKTMFPSLRIGFLVLPERLLAPTRIPLQEMLRGGHRFEQLAMAAFIDSGQFSRHLGRMRRLYRDRQQALREALIRHLGVPHRIEGGHCGLHLTVRLPGHFPDVRIAKAAQHYGMAPGTLSGYALQAQPQDNGLVLGYGNTSAELFAPLVQRLGDLAQGLDQTDTFAI